MNNKLGFTLIEVLIALAIISIAFTAILKATAQNIQNTLYLQDKTLATWVGTEIINDIRVGLLKLTAPTYQVADRTTLLNQTFFWQATLKPTNNPHIHEIEVKVNQHQHLLASLVSYFYE